MSRRADGGRCCVSGPAAKRGSQYDCLVMEWQFCFLSCCYSCVSLLRQFNPCSSSCWISCWQDQFIGRGLPPDWPSHAGNSGRRPRPSMRFPVPMDEGRRVVTINEPGQEQAGGALSENREPTHLKEQLHRRFCIRVWLDCPSHLGCCILLRSRQEDIYLTPISPSAAEELSTTPSYNQGSNEFKPEEQKSVNGSRRKDRTIQTLLPPGTARMSIFKGSAIRESKGHAFKGGDSSCREWGNGPWWETRVCKQIHFAPENP